MAKNKKAKKAASGGAQKAPTIDAADPGIAAFERGQYPEARARLTEKLARDDLPEGERALLTTLISATRVDKTTALTGLGCFALFLVAIFITWLKQG